MQVIRYVRPKVFGYNTWPSPSNLGGITFVFDVDYDKRTVDVRFSICRPNDNFNKDLAISIAKANEGHKFNLDCFKKAADLCGGFVRAFVASATSDVINNVASPRIITMLKQLQRIEAETL